MVDVVVIGEISDFVILVQVLFRDLDGSLMGHVGGWATTNSGLHPLYNTALDLSQSSVLVVQ